MEKIPSEEQGVDGVAYQEGSEKELGPAVDLETHTESMREDNTPRGEGSSGNALLLENNDPVPEEEEGNEFPKPESIVALATSDRLEDVAEKYSVEDIEASLEGCRNQAEEAFDALPHNVREYDALVRVLRKDERFKDVVRVLDGYAGKNPMRTYISMRKESFRSWGSRNGSRWQKEELLHFMHELAVTTKAFELAREEYDRIFGDSDTFEERFAETRINDPEEAHIVAQSINKGRDIASEYTNFLEQGNEYTGGQEALFRSLKEQGWGARGVENFFEEVGNNSAELYRYKKELMNAERYGDVKKVKLLQLQAMREFFSWKNLRAFAWSATIKTYARVAGREMESMPEDVLRDQEIVMAPFKFELARSTFARLQGEQSPIPSVRSLFEENKLPTSFIPSLSSEEFWNRVDFIQAEKRSKGADQDVILALVDTFSESYHEFLSHGSNKKLKDEVLKWLRDHKVTSVHDLFGDYTKIRNGVASVVTWFNEKKPTPEKLRAIINQESVIVLKSISDTKGSIEHKKAQVRESMMRIMYMTQALETV